MAEIRPIAAVSERHGHEAAHGDAVRAMFDRIAPTYDLLNRVMSAGLDERWRARAVAELSRAPRGEVLDLCAGTLDLSRAIERTYPERSVVAADFAADMLERGRHKVARTEVVVADALNLPFESGRFAGVICGFGLRNLSDPRKGIAEAVRVLAPGGRLVILEFFRGERAVTRAFHVGFARVASVAGDAYAYLARSMATFLTRRELESMLREHGFVDVHGEDLTLGVASIVAGTRGRS
jgi:ubiquinone/menaquinone biosynthesis methyltransferase